MVNFLPAFLVLVFIIFVLFCFLRKPRKSVSSFSLTFDCFHVFWTRGNKREEEGIF